MAPPSGITQSPHAPRPSSLTWRLRVPGHSGGRRHDGDAGSDQGQIEERFVKVALDPAGEQKFPVGPEQRQEARLRPAEIDALPPSVTESFCGVGNPLGLGELRPGQTVLDLGCGAGMDSLLAARRVGPTGKVIGVDLCPAMVEKARRNAVALGPRNVEFARPGPRRCRCRTARWTW